MYFYEFSFPKVFPKHSLRAVALGFYLMQLHLEDGSGGELVEDEQVWGDEDEGGEDGQDQDKNHLQRSCYLGLRENIARGTTDPEIDSVTCFKLSNNMATYM